MWENGLTGIDKQGYGGEGGPAGSERGAPRPNYMAPGSGEWGAAPAPPARTDLVFGGPPRTTPLPNVQELGLMHKYGLEADSDGAEIRNAELCSDRASAPRRAPRCR